MKASFKGNTLTKEQTKAVREIIFEVIDNHFNYTRTRINKFLQAEQDRLKEHLFCQMESFLNGNYALLMRDKEENE